MTFAKRAIKTLLRLSNITSGLIRRDGGAHILMLHGVGDADLSVSDFRNVMVWLKSKFEIVSLEALVNRISSDDRSARHCFAVTFDDGLRNQYTNAYPVLQELEIPATFFVCPGLVDEGKRIWTHDARFRLRHLDKNNRRARKELKRFGYRSNDVIEWMKTLQLPERNEVEQWLESATPDFVMSEAELHESELMTWEDLKRLDPALITIGSHTLTHPILARVPDAVAETEIRDSKIRLEAELGRPIDFFCFPNGDHTPTALKFVELHYRAGLGTHHGMNRQGMGLAALLRVHIHPRRSEMAWNLFRVTV